MSIMKDEIPFTNDAIRDYMRLAKLEMSKIEPQYKLYVALKKRIKLAEQKIKIHSESKA